MNEFVHLHLHTEYSLLDGACRIKQGDSSPLFDRVKALGQTAAAITDHGVMYGVIDFYHAAKKAGVKPIIGCEVYVAPRTRFDRTYEFDSEARHLVLLCKNMTGYKNLIQLVSAGFTEGFYIKPRVDYELLAAHSEGLIALSACLAGEVATKAQREGFDAARDAALRLFNIFGEDNFYLELQDHGIPEQREVNRILVRISEETGIPLVATNDVHYVTKENARMQDVLLCIQTGRTLTDENRMRFSGDGFYIKSGEEMAALFPGHPEAIANTVKIAERCQLEFEFGHYHLPAFDTPEGKTASVYLRELAHKGFARRFPTPSKAQTDQLEFELDMIERMGFCDYFLIVSDFTTYARSKGISVGPGRGSAAGSLVSYSLGITDINPVRYALVFERFLNPERVSMPDIDIDFCYMRRQEVIDYVTEKYGADRVTQIVTFGTMAARAAIRDVGRVMGMPYGDVDRVAKQVPFEPGMTLEKALSVSEPLRELCREDARVQELIDMAKAIEGMPRHASTHAAGVVITERPVWEYVPLAKNDEAVVTQFPMGTLESLGLLKMDFLGLRTLTVIDDAEKMIRRRCPEFSVSDIPEDEEDVFLMLSQGKTSGVFQVESEGMTNLMTNLRPRSIEDITAAIALYRPGPMQYIPKYIESRHNPEKISYRHPMLEPILSVTYGCMIYQEQVMEVFRRLAGYSLGRADIVRRAMSKKKMEQLKKERENFLHGNPEEGIPGAAANGVDEQTGNIIFDEIMDFANYAFNKAHAVSYAVLCYRTAYLKCRYPGEFMAALLTSVLDSAGKISEYIAECREMGIRVLPPDINQSEANFTCINGAIRFGLVAVKNIGRGFIDKVVEEREKNGAFSSLQDFCERMASQELNRRAVESLIKSGAFDGFGAKRAQHMRVLGPIIDYAAADARKNLEGQMNLFGEVSGEIRDEVMLPQMEEFDARTLLSMEKEAVGLYLSGHPMDAYRQTVREMGALPLGRLSGSALEGQADPDSMKTPEISDGSLITVAGVISSLKLKTTKSGSTMAYLTLEDQSGSAELLAFSKLLAESGEYLRADEAVVIFGRLSVREDEAPKIICERAFPLTEAGVEEYKKARKQTVGGMGDFRRQFVRPSAGELDSEQRTEKEADSLPPSGMLYVNITNGEDKRIPRIKAVLRMFPGGFPVVFCFRSEKNGKLAVTEPMFAAWDRRMTEELSRIVGKENVKIGKKSKR